MSQQYCCGGRALASVFFRITEKNGLQALVQQNEAVTFPVWCLYSVPASAAEQEQCVGKWIKIELVLLPQTGPPAYTTGSLLRLA